jgi:hypothetical protein
MNESCYKDYLGYHIYSNGKVFSTKTNKFLKESYCSSGYLKYQLTINGIGVTKYYHRLIAELYIPNPENKEQVNHIDGDKSNNCISNLEWCTISENIKHAFDTGLNKTSPERLLLLKLKRSKKVINTKTGEIYQSAKEASRFLSINYSVLSEMLSENGKLKNKTSLKYI